MKKSLISILLCSMFLTGCAGAKIENVSIGGSIYETPYEMAGDKVIMIQDLEVELEKNGVKLQEIEDGFLFTNEYYVSEDYISVNITVTDRPGEKYDKTIQHIRIETWEKPKELGIHPVVKSIANVMDEEIIISWLSAKEKEMEKIHENISSNKNGPELEESYKNPRNFDEIADMITIGRNYITFFGSERQVRKELEFSWGVLPHVSKELQGVAAELENKGLLTTSYIKGLGGDQINISTPQYYLSQNNRYYYNQTEKIIVESDKAVAYKVMYDPHKTNSYSVQVYGLMRADIAYTTKVEDMAGIDTISRAMKISGEDFTKLITKINEELAKARGLLNPNLQREYYNEGDIGGYYYMIYVPSGIDLYRFTVLVEKR